MNYPRCGAIDPDTGTTCGIHADAEHDLHQSGPHRTWPVVNLGVEQFEGWRETLPEGLTFDQRIQRVEHWFNEHPRFVKAVA